ncbi:MAG: prepilin-type N-terminal cleavage/methylation domain-containing protein [Magnetococcales bacterium]|nr:prepilin-type N-terminal cleavage/methylation domain-containing protein [Magnetococcales bacterium]
MRHSPESRGFTLVELLIVVAIIAVLSAVALPNYQDSVRKSRRADAQQLMTAIANREEVYLLDAMSYSNSFTTLNFTLNGWTCANTTCTNAYYTVIVTPGTGAPPSFTITATPVAASTQASDGILTLTNTGTKTRNGVSGW